MNKDLFLDEKDLVKDYSLELNKKIRAKREELFDLWKKRDFENIVRVGEEALPQLPSKVSGDGDKNMGEIYFLIASAMWELKRDKSLVERRVKTAAHFNRENDGVLWLIREIRGETSPNAKYFKADAEGCVNVRYKDGVKKEKFLTLYGAVADSVEEALEFAKDFERPELAAELTFAKHKTSEAKKDLPKGIYKTVRPVFI